MGRYLEELAMVVQRLVEKGMERARAFRHVRLKLLASALECEEKIEHMMEHGRKPTFDDRQEISRLTVLSAHKRERLRDLDDLERRDLLAPSV